MSGFDFDNFEVAVNDVLIRHKSILDVITKIQESSSKVNRAIIKSVTNCGCVQIEGKLQEAPEHITFDELTQYMNSHIHGDLCETCKEKIEQELGNHLFYITAACSLLNIKVEDVLQMEYNKIKTLGKYSLF